MKNAMQKKIILGILSLVLSMIAEVLKAEIVHDFSKSNLEGWYVIDDGVMGGRSRGCLLYTSPSPRDVEESRMPSSA